jgi:hypothetical protein
MKQIKEEMHRKWKERRQNTAGNWSSLIIKIALLILIVWLMFNIKSGRLRSFKNLFLNKQTTQQLKESQ